MKKNSYNIAIVLTQIIHFIYLILLAASIPLLVIYEPFWVWVPLNAWVAHHIFARHWRDCPLTRIENKFRKEMGKPEIQTFTLSLLENIRKKYMGIKDNGIY